MSYGYSIFKKQNRKKAFNLIRIDCRDEKFKINKTIMSQLNENVRENEKGNSNPVDISEIKFPFSIKPLNDLFRFYFYILDSSACFKNLIDIKNSSLFCI